MDARKVLIAEGSEDFRLALTEALQCSYYVRSCKDGLEALSLLKSYSPDILVLDLMLPGMDGISLLQTAAESGICPMVLATVRYFSNYMTDALVKLGVEYVMTKPCDLRATVERIHDLSFRIRQPLISVPDPRNQVSAILSTLGVPAKYKGYGYLREAILCIARQPDQGITKELYPTIAAMFGSQVTGQNVERSIRNAIEQAWLRRDDRICKMYFTPDRNGEIPKPSNSDFIHTLADTLQLSQAAITG